MKNQKLSIDLENRMDNISNGFDTGLACCSGLILAGYGTIGEWMTLDPENSVTQNLTRN